ncbi:MAG: hypothetical protein AAF968_03150 [Pseudomonadota bacterium]
MLTRSSSVIMTFPRPFTLSGYTDELPAGDYEVQVEEELLLGLSFVAYRRTGTYIVVRGTGHRANQREFRQVDPAELDAAIDRHRQMSH